MKSLGSTINLQCIHISAINSCVNAALALWGDGVLINLEPLEHPIREVPSLVVAPSQEEHLEPLHQPIDWQAPHDCNLRAEAASPKTQPESKMAQLCHIWLTIDSSLEGTLLGAGV